MTRVIVNAGVCGSISTIDATRLSKRVVGIKIDTPCKNVMEIKDQLAKVDWTEIFKSPRHSPVYGPNMHAACPVPVAILKAIEAEVGAALPREVTIRFEPEVESKATPQL